MLAHLSPLIAAAILLISLNPSLYIQISDIYSVTEVCGLSTTEKEPEDMGGK